MVDDVNQKIAAKKASDAFTKIEAAAANSDASAVGIQDFVDAGVTGAITANLSEYQARIAASAQSAVSTLAQL